MSSPKAAKVSAKSARPSAAAAKMKEAAVRTVAPAIKTPQTGLSADAIKLAAEIEAAFNKSDDAITEEAMQTLMATLCRVYAAQVENGSPRRFRALSTAVYGSTVTHGALRSIRRAAATVATASPSTLTRARGNVSGRGP